MSLFAVVLSRPATEGDPDEMTVEVARHGNAYYVENLFSTRAAAEDAAARWNAGGEFRPEIPAGPLASAHAEDLKLFDAAVADGRIPRGYKLMLRRTDRPAFATEGASDLHRIYLDGPTGRVWGEA
jgi:hypothetical protein